MGGNCSARLERDDTSLVIVSKSGKAPHKAMDISTDFAVITHFDWSRWSCDYWASDATVLPTSDTPLHCALLLNTRRHMRWTEYPEVVLHGHAFETEAEAAACGYPISTEETLFSTRDDTDALMALVDRFPYPQHDIFIRKAHGFLLLAGSTAAAKATFDARMKPHLIHVEDF